MLAHAATRTDPQTQLGALASVFGSRLCLNLYKTLVVIHSNLQSDHSAVEGTPIRNESTRILGPAHLAIDLDIWTILGGSGRWPQRWRQATRRC